ncbi:membrane protein [Paenibacillus curdlanolyticus]|nr:membrane protein [Paenibacillus curdlanolyticus]
MKVTLLLIGLPILALCVWGLPSVIQEAAEQYKGYVVYPLFGIMYAAAIPYFLALYQAYKLLNYIDKNIAFSELSVRALKTITYCAIAISILFTAGLPFIYLIADQDDAPGLIVLGLVIIFASSVIGVFAAVLQRLLKNAIDIKSENDLTV